MLVNLFYRYEEPLTIDLNDYKNIEDIVEDFYEYLLENAEEENITLNRVEKFICVSCYSMVEEIQNGDLDMLEKIFSMKDYNDEIELKMICLYQTFNDYKNILDTYEDVEKIELELENFDKSKMIYEVENVDFGFKMFQIKS